MFVNRVTESDLLEKRFASEKANFFVLYSRRRAGFFLYGRAQACTARN
jgi:hypothetical protein